MSDQGSVTNVVVAGLGGQGVLKASDILSEAAFRARYDVKKSEVHGMSQRGGSVHSDVRFGEKVLSPMVPAGEADALVVLDSTQVDANRYKLREGGLLITPETLLGEGADVDAVSRDETTPVNRQNMNVALLGVLSAHLSITEEDWLAAVFANLPKKAREQNAEVFALGRTAVLEKA
jgi:indolepyruvate ferredoxin oxidoreductase beta subunit